MLVGYRGHLRLGGHLFLMLPLLCLTNSKHTTRRSFVQALERVGFRVRETRESPKVAFFCATATEPQAPERQGGQEKSEVTDGGTQDTRRAGSKVAKRRHRGTNDFAVTFT